MSSVSMFECLRVFCLNIRSLRKHFDELVVYINSLNFSYKVIILTEVWIKTGEESRYQIQGYNMLFQPRPDNRAGGVVIYVDSDLKATHQLILYPTSELINVIFSISCNNHIYNISLFGIYRQCKFTFNQFKLHFENIVQMPNDPTIIMGDMNICLLNNNGSAREYLNLISSFGFESMINKPTRIFNDRESCIDHALVRSSRDLKFVCNIIELDISDHYALELLVYGVECKKPIIEYSKTVDHVLFNRQLRLADWSEVLEEEDVNVCVSKFYNVYNNCFNASCTLKRVNSKNRRRREWVSDNLIVLINKKNLLFKEYCKDRTNYVKRNEYKLCASIVTKQIKRAKLKYYSSLIDKYNNNSKGYWNVIRKIIKNKNKVLDCVKVQDRKVDVTGNEEVVANAFNNYFTTIVPSLKQDSFGCDLFSEYNTIYDVYFDKFECNYIDVVKCIKSMKNKNSCGNDGITIYIIKKNIEIFSSLLFNIFKKSLDQGIVPIEFKTATVVPIYKAGDVTECSSYRPISVISTMAKIFETLVKNQLLKYFEAKSLFSGNQFGFLPGRGTDLAIEKHISRIVTSFDKQMYTIAVYLDFQKAFDMLDINVLITKFKKYGIGGLALSWLESFCKGRRQAVRIDKYISSTLELQFGTAQGGVLGPIVFLIYINDLLNLRFNSSVFAYADDMALVCSAYDRQILQSRIQADLDKVSQWLIENRLIININKSKCIMFFDWFKCKKYLTNSLNLVCHAHQCLYNCNCKSIEVVEHVRYLGIYVDQHLKWNEQINSLYKRLRKVNYALYYMKKFIRGDQLRQLYISWFEAVLRYGIIHFGGTYHSILNPIVMAQRNALRTVFNVKRTDRMSYLFSQNNLLTFNQIYEYSILMYVHKYLNLFSVKPVHRVTRRAQFVALEVPFCAKETSKHQFSYLGPKYFNNFIEYFGNGLCFESKPKVKIKAIQFVKRHHDN